jgi:hypothetical protein
MKPYIFLLFSFFIINSSIAQNPVPEQLTLNITKKSIKGSKSAKVILQFKPGKFLKIKTSDGKKLISQTYALQDSSIVMVTISGPGKAKLDTIPFQDIVRIKGKVYGDTGRKIGGAVLVLGGVPLTIMAYIIATISSTPLGAAIMMTPCIGISASGISIMGARGFNTSDKWTLKTTMR